MLELVNTSRVFVANHTEDLSYEGATEHGELVPVVSGRVNPFAPGVLRDEVASKLENFDRDRDFLMPAGSTLAVGFCFAFLAQLAERETHSRVKLLLWDSKRRSYFVRTVEL